MAKFEIVDLRTEQGMKRAEFLHNKGYKATQVGWDKWIYDIPDEMPEKCDAIIDLGRPTRTEKRRGFQPPWYTVFIYKCPKCGAEHVLRANSFIGKRPVPSVGGCKCGRYISPDLDKEKTNDKTVSS